MAVSDEPEKPAVSVQISSAQAIAWLKANWPRYWEIGLYALIIAVAASLRLWDLGARSFNHDESLHATYSWYLFNGDGYQHDPMMHGPLQFHLNALLWKSLSFVSAAPLLNNWAHWGPSDYTARMSYALVGTGIVALPFFLRSYIGRIGGLFAAVLLAFSPVILYFNRFARGDTLFAFFTLAAVICIWRYLSERRELYLFLIAGALALAFATKETSFLLSALLLLYLDLLLAWEILTSMRERMESQATVDAPPEKEPTTKRRKRKEAPPPPPQAQWSPYQWALLFVALVPVAWLIAATWPLTGKWRARWHIDQWPLSGDLLIVIGTLAGVQFAAGVQLIPFIGDSGYYKDVAGGEHTLMKISVFGFLFVSAYVGLLWRPRTWLICAGIFYVIFVLLYTTFFTNMPGFWSGIWGSFDYWLQQQNVQRGDQPVYYYLMILPMYEFLPLLVAVVGAGWFLLRRNLLPAVAAIIGVCLMLYVYFTYSGSLAGMLPVLIVVGAVLFAFRLDLFTTFLIFWAVGSLIAYTTAGEKMPWLAVHMTIPLIILAAKSVNTLFERFNLRLPLNWRSPQTLVLLAAACGGLSMIVLWVTAFSTLGAMVALILGVAAAGLIARASTVHGALLGAQTSAALIIPALFIFTVRDTLRANYDLGTWPREILSYADTSPGLPFARDQLVSLADQSGLGHDYPVVADNEIAWPMVWYFRDYHKVQWASGSLPPPVSGSMVLLKIDHQSWMDPYLDDYNPPISIRHLWWFGDGPQYYQGITTTGFAKALFDKSVWNVWRNYFVWRNVPWEPPPNDALLYIPKSLATTASTPVKAVTIPTVTVPPASQLVIGGTGSGAGQLDEPTDVTVDAAGNIYVSEGRNNRIQVFDANGKSLRVFQPTGDAALKEPWSVAVAADGSIYVSDTWNYRIAKYDATFNLIWQTDASTLGFYGPRDLLALPDGSVLVADTGNKRIVKLGPDGALLGSYGSDGTGPGQFNEPVGLALGPNGNIYVADTWNGRVQVFDSSFKYVTEFKVKGWGSQEVTAKPYLAVLPDGRVILSSPANQRVELYGGFGTATAAWELPAAQGVNGRPVGIALDDKGFLYVADCAGNMVYRLPVSSLTGQ